MESTIQCFNIYDDGLIEMVVKCNNCNNINSHTITHSSRKNGKKTTIDFSKLGKRCCDNNGIPNKPETICFADYNLYL